MQNNNAKRLTFLSSLVFLTAASVSACSAGGGLSAAKSEATPTVTATPMNGPSRYANLPKRAVPAGAELEKEIKAVSVRLSKETPDAQDGVFPLHRLYLSGQHHFYTASSAEMKAAEREGYTNEGDVGGVLDSPELGTLPLFHLFGHNDHFYTTDYKEAVTAVDTFEYSYCEVAGFVYQVGAPSSRPVYRHYNKTLIKHVYTKDAEESARIPATGWALEMTAFNTVKP